MIAASQHSWLIESADRAPRRQLDGLVVVGNAGGTNVGSSLEHAAVRAGIKTHFFDARRGFAGPRPLRLLSWHLAGHRPLALGESSRQLVQACSSVRPRWLIATGIVPINALALRELGRLGIVRMNYLTDDPWNPAFRSRWLFDALREYDHVFSVRHGNIQDLQRLGCRGVSYLPFGYDRDLHYRETPGRNDEWEKLAVDVVFAGGAERERVPYIAALIESGYRVALYGDYWERYPQTRAHTRGHADVETLRRATSAAAVALCLVRRANRDGHVMRSMEIPAVGACMLADDTAEHRALFGPDGVAVAYFRGVEDMATKLRWLLEHSDERCRLAAAALRLVVGGPHTYDDRLQDMLARVESLPALA
jgi:spore maturation protein CgeB